MRLTAGRQSLPLRLAARWQPARRLVVAWLAVVMAAVFALDLVTITFGVLLLLWPTVSLEVLVLLFGAFALVEGGLVLTTATLAPRGEPGRTIAIIAGVVGVMVAIVTFLWPGVTQLALVILIALRALLVGLAEVALAVRIGRHATGRGLVWVLAPAGLVSAAFGVVLLLYPGAGLLALVWLMGVCAVMLGIIMIAKAWLVTLSSQTLIAAHR